jgi:hypothetical protein
MARERTFAGEEKWRREEEEPKEDRESLWERLGREIFGFGEKRAAHMEPEERYAEEWRRRRYGDQEAVREAREDAQERGRRLYAQGYGYGETPGARRPGWETHRYVERGSYEGEESREAREAAWERLGRELFGHFDWRRAERRETGERQPGREDRERTGTGAYGPPEAWSYGPSPMAGRGPRGYRRSDARIREDLCERLTEHGWIDATDVTADVNEGEVVLTGFVRTRREKRAAEDLAEGVPGVRDVQNRLRVGEYREEERAREARERRPLVFGVFRAREEVARTIDELKRAGFQGPDISAIFPDIETTKNFALDKGTKVMEGASLGTGSGIAATLSGVGVEGAVGGVMGALVSMGLPRYEAKRYENRVKTDHILLGVSCVDREGMDRAVEILDSAGAYDISRAGEQYCL